MEMSSVSIPWVNWFKWRQLEKYPEDNKEIRTWLDNLHCYFKQFIILKAYLGAIKSKFLKIIHMESFQTCDIKHGIDTLQPNTSQYDSADKQVFFLYMV